MREDGSPFDVFVSYARSDGDRWPTDLMRALAVVTPPIRAYVDTCAAPLDDRFPDDIRDALLGSRAVVAFVSTEYFERSWCLREWHLALAPYRLGRHASDATRASALRHVVVVLPTTIMPEATWRLLPPELQVRTAARADQTAELVQIIRGRCFDAAGGPMRTLRQRLDDLAITNDALDSFAAEDSIPMARPLRGTRQYPRSFEPTLGRSFVGRADDLWRIHTLLVGGGTARNVAPASVAVRAMGGAGKTTLVREYLHRFGPTHYRGGLFWIDASPSADALHLQHHGMWAALHPDATPLDDLAKRFPTEAERERHVASRLAEALHAIAPAERVLVVIDNIPCDEAGSRALSSWCPAAEQVSLLATSRSFVPGATEQMVIDMLDPAAAISLLARHVDRGALATDDWEEIARWVGHMPLALELLSRALGQGALSPRQLADHARRRDALPALEQQASALVGLVSENHRRGIAETFALSYELLSEPARRAARMLAWMAPALAPELLQAAILDAATEGGDAEPVSASLVSRSFVAVAGDPSRRGWRMHTLLAEYLRRCADAEAGWQEVLEIVRIMYCELSAELAGELKAPLLDCVGAVQELLGRRPPGRSSDSKADAEAVRLLELSSELHVLASAGTGDAPVRCAIAAGRLALEAAPRDRSPSLWADGQGQMGALLADLGEREVGTVNLEGAVRAYRLALEECPRERAPRGWAMIQSNLGTTLAELAERERSHSRMSEAIEAFELAAEVRLDGSDQVLLATTYLNLGAALRTQGEQARDRSRLLRAMELLQTAARVFHGAGDRRAWALAQGNSAIVLMAMDDIEGERSRAADAAQLFEAALAALSPECTPREWAKTQANLGSALLQAGRDGNHQGTLERAVEAFRRSLEYTQREDDVRGWATLQGNLGQALSALGHRSRDAGTLREAVGASRLAAGAFSRERSPEDWARAQYNLGCSLRNLGGPFEDAAALSEAITAFRSALAVWTRERDPIDWASAHEQLGGTLRAMSAVTRDLALMAEAVIAYRSAIDVFALQRPARANQLRKQVADLEVMVRLSRSGCLMTVLRLLSGRLSGSGTR